MAAAETRGGSTFCFQSEQKAIVKNLTDANKDNDFIYHAKIPELSSLPTIGKATVAKSTPLASPMSTNFKGTIWIGDSPFMLAWQQIWVGFKANMPFLLIEKQPVKHSRECLALVPTAAARLLEEGVLQGIFKLLICNSLYH